jgi:drug/metabolite transporter (DMT)-like permease
MKPLDTLLFAGCVTIWGTTWLAIKFQLGEVPPITSVAVRFACAAAIAGLIAHVRGKALRASLPLQPLLLGMGLCMFTLGYACVYVAETYVVSALVALGYSVSPLANQLGERIVFRRPLNGAMAAAGLLGVLGVVLIYYPEVRSEQWSQGTLSGIGFTALAVFSSTIGALFARRLGETGIDVWRKMAFSMGYGALGAALVAIALDEATVLPTRSSYYLSLAYLVLFGSVAAFACYLTLLGRVGTVRAGYVGVAVPVLALGVSVAFEGYKLTAWSYAGVLLAVCGQLTMNRARET